MPEQKMPKIAKYKAFRNENNDDCFYVKKII